MGVANTRSKKVESLIKSNTRGIKMVQIMCTNFATFALAADHSVYFTGYDRFKGRRHKYKFTLFDKQFEKSVQCLEYCQHSVVVMRKMNNKYHIRAGYHGNDELKTEHICKVAYYDRTAYLLNGTCYFFLPF